MAGEWEETSLADVSADVAYGYTESASDEKVGPRFLRITDIQNGVVDWASVPYCPISESDHRKYHLHSGDIVVARTGNSTGENYLYRGTEDAVYASYLIHFRVNQSTAHPAFVWYNMRTQRWQDFINSSKTGSAQAGANAKVLGLFPLSLPPLAEQKAIAGVLGALDDKIELNRRMNATLEAMARALFQSWFVDFDPVRAKLDGRTPVGMDPATAALFPASFQDSALGPIPHGWEIKSLGEVADLTWGDTNTTKASYISDGFIAFSASGSDGYLPYFDFEKTGVVISAIGANAGVTWLAHGNWSCIKNTLRFWATSPDVSTEFLFFATYGREKWPQRGSAQPFISQGDARAMKVLVPTGALAESFGAVVRPWLATIEHNLNQSRTLATLRDTLLPKLLSGELSVAGASAKVAASL